MKMWVVGTSAHVVVDLRRPDRRTPMRALVAKIFLFADKVWMAYLLSMPDIWYVACTHTIERICRRACRKAKHFGSLYIGVIP